MAGMCMVSRPFFRVDLASEDGDTLVIHVPLGQDGRIDLRTPGPHLVKGRWAGASCYGEIVLTGGRHNRFVWGPDVPESLTDIGLEPLQIGASVLVWETDDVTARPWRFSVRDILRL